MNGTLALNSLSQFLSDYPGMSIVPFSDTGVYLPSITFKMAQRTATAPFIAPTIFTAFTFARNDGKSESLKSLEIKKSDRWQDGVYLRGKFRFKADLSGRDEIEDFYKLEIFVPDNFPQALPKVKEIGGKIPREGNFHVNHDGTICLGSPLRLLKKVHSTPNLICFVEKCLVPYLYAVSYKLMHGGEFVFGELAHGDQGIVDDYSVILGLQEGYQVTRAIQLLGIKKRIANKKLCPCGCRKRLGACPFHDKLNEFRKMTSVSWFKAHVARNRSRS